nr:MAG TPA: hypothetical protein [Caudoviricetes sp.]
MRAWRPELLRRSVAERRFFMADCKGVQLLDSL